ncbi:hypothetical protein QTP70_010091 [Hemibagrus guttatus]|uniref:Uncharacterized protein n=1 Tax=Hemibagrus guttatus TaxID=175788 RepID=A0AAE0UMY9_9TELE|nr:hypothetical protein QTP70_010091 [Hemibagrus guttatus]
MFVLHREPGVYPKGLWVQEKRREEKRIGEKRRGEERREDEKRREEKRREEERKGEKRREEKRRGEERRGEKEKKREEKRREEKRREEKRREDDTVNEGHSAAIVCVWLRSINVCNKMLEIFSQSVVTSAIYCAVVCWVVSISASRINKLILKAGSITGHKLIFNIPSTIAASVFPLCRDIFLGPALRGRVTPVFPSDGGRTRSPRAAAAPDLMESEPQAQPAAQKPTGATPARGKATQGRSGRGRATFGLNRPGKRSRGLLRKAQWVLEQCWSRLR